MSRILGKNQPGIKLRTASRICLLQVEISGGMAARRRRGSTAAERIAAAALVRVFTARSRNERGAKKEERSGINPNRSPCRDREAGQKTHNPTVEFFRQKPCRSIGNLDSCALIHSGTPSNTADCAVSDGRRDSPTAQPIGNRLLRIASPALQHAALRCSDLRQRECPPPVSDPAGSVSENLRCPRVFGSRRAEGKSDKAAHVIEE